MLRVTRISSDRMDSVEEQICELEARLYQAMADSDFEALDELIADDLVFVGPDGQLASKQSDLELHRSGATHFTSFEPKDLQVRVFEGFAIAYARIYLSGTFLEHAFSGEFQYSRVWVRREKGWQIVSGSVSPVQTP